MFDRVVRLVALGVLGLVVLLSLATPIQAAGQPLLYLPTPPGETWEVIQGYNCGSHDGWGRLHPFGLFEHTTRSPQGRRSLRSGPRAARVRES